MNVLQTATQRLGKRGYGYSRHTLAESALDTEDAVERHWREILSEAGLVLERVVKVRADTRGVFLVEHPEFGKCVLKTLLDTRHPEKSWANLMIANMVEAFDVPIFPKILRIKSSYTIEEYIEGKSFMEWIEHTTDLGAVRSYFQCLKDLSERNDRESTAKYLKPDELKSITSNYVKKCLNHYRFFDHKKQTHSWWKLFKDRRLIYNMSREVNELSSKVKIRKGIMCGDMGMVNLIVSDNPSQIYNIDYETMSYSSWIFDGAYFVSSIAKFDNLREPAQKIRVLIRDEVIGDDKESAVLFDSLTSLLSKISYTLYSK